MGLRAGVVAAGLVLVLSSVAAGASVEPSARYLLSRQAASGGFAEPGSAPTGPLTAWVVLGLRAAGRSPARAGVFLAEREHELSSVTDMALSAMAQATLGRRPDALLQRLRAAPLRTVNGAVWTILAMRQSGRTAATALVRYVRRQQTPAGGWGWAPGGAPDSNDTAAAIQALRASGVSGAPIRRGLAYLRRLQNRDGGFELTPGRGSDAQSTAWAIQAFLAAGQRPGRRAYAYLARLRRPDGSYRYSARYIATPVWVTSQVLAALAGKSLPLRLRGG